MVRSKHVIIGNGPAGITAADTIRGLSGDDDILIITDEPHRSYSRFLLPDYVAGRASLDRLWLHAESEHREARIELRLGQRVTSVRPEQNSVTTQTGEEIGFERLLIACGGQPVLPSIEGLADAKPLKLKTLADAQHIIAVATKGRSVLVVGSDLIGEKHFLE